MTAKQPSFMNIPIKYFVLCLLVVQNGGAVLLMRAVRAVPGQTAFVTQTAVIMQEVLKAVTCIVMVLCQFGTLRKVVESPAECLKTSVPALLYLAQNNLQYAAAGLLSAPTYAVTYQTKIFWVGICSVVLLKKTVLSHQWVALGVLMCGVCVVQLDSFTALKAGGAVVPRSMEERAVGLSSLLCAALCSALAGVSFEKLLKGASTDMWTRNLHLAFFSIVCAFLPLMASADGVRVMQNGFFYGYTPLTWLCIAMNGWGGLLVGAVIKYADAIMKDIAIGASITISATGSMFFFGSPVSLFLILGIALVSWAVPMYAGRGHLGFAFLGAPEVTKEEESVLVTGMQGKIQSPSGSVQMQNKLAEGKPVDEEKGKV